MPQMNPMNWFLLFMFFNLNLFFAFNKISFYYNYFLISKKDNNKDIKIKFICTI